MSPVARYLAERFRRSKAGKTGVAVRDVILVFKDLLDEIDCRHGPERHGAIQDLEELENCGIVRLERHRRDPAVILKVRLPAERAGDLFVHLGESAPDQERELLAALFDQARETRVPAEFSAGWESFCREMASAARDGSSLQPLDRSNPGQIKKILDALPAILAWEGESFLRFASSTLFADSKQLETLRPRLEACLGWISGGMRRSLADFGIIEHPRSLLVHGPVTLGFAEGTLPLGLLTAPARISLADIRRSTLSTTATRCLTIENAAMLHELAKRQGDFVLASSGSEGGFANSAVIAFLQALPSHLELWHFGDADPKGFEILRDLRLRSGREIRSLHMTFRPAPTPGVPLTANDKATIERLRSGGHLTPEECDQLAAMERAGTKGCFEQESLGHPGDNWLFYEPFRILSNPSTK